MVFQVGVVHHLMHEACGVFHACGIGCGIGTVESQVEMEVGEILLQTEEVLEIEHLVERTRTIEIVHLAIGGMERLGHVHNLRTERSHTGTTTNPDHLLLRVEVRMEVAERTTHNHLVAGFQREDVRRSDTGVHIHEAAAIGLERRCGNTHGEHEHVTLSRVVGHRVGTDGGLGIHALEREQAELLPCGQILVADETLVDVLVVVHRECGNLDLSVRTGDEVHVGTLRQLHLELLDEGSHVLVADHGTLILLHAEDALRHVDLEVALHLALTAQAPARLDFLTGEVRLLRVEDLSPTLKHLHLALSARSLSAAGRRQEDAVLVERGHQR